jgi:hypothetical protein
MQLVHCMVRSFELEQKQFAPVGYCHLYLSEEDEAPLTEQLYVEQKQGLSTPLFPAGAESSLISCMPAQLHTHTHTHVMRVLSHARNAPVVLLLQGRPVA